MILVIDNFDSFTYNLVQLLGRLKEEVVVRRNNEISASDISGLRPSGILISPGPGRPEDAGVSVEVIQQLGGSIPIFGVCLGHQAIGYAFGGTIVHAPSLMHGRTSLIHHHNEGLFENIPSPFIATRYHSLVISHEGFPAELEVTATADSNVIMGIKHRRLPITGVQFHPESILTESGEEILSNWLKVKKS